jgi:hypothetical protein
MESRQKQITKSIIKFYGGNRKKFTTTQLLKYVTDKIGTTFVMPDTVLRIMRQLRSDKILNYECYCPRSMIYIITKKPSK